MTAQCAVLGFKVWEPGFLQLGQLPPASSVGRAGYSRLQQPCQFRRSCAMTIDTAVATALRRHALLPAGSRTCSRCIMPHSRSACWHATSAVPGQWPRCHELPDINCSSCRQLLWAWHTALSHTTSRALWPGPGELAVVRPAAHRPRRCCDARLRLAGFRATKHTHPAALASKPPPTAVTRLVAAPPCSGCGAAQV